VRHEVLLPALGDAESGTVAEWYHRSGDQVRPGDALVAVDVDKVVIDVPALAAGELTVEATEGTEVIVGGLLGWISDES
jgi:2-oxoglutarate dehydrogenase E2 component (dihydrolipoamide succinyltransferase)